MTRRVPNRSRRSWARGALFLLFLFPLLPSRLAAADPFPGYPEDVRSQAVRVVEAAGPGKEEALEREVRSLRRAMFHHAILSMNAVPDRIFDRSVREGWNRRSYGSLRAVAARGAALRPPLGLACLGGRGAFPSRGVPLRRRGVVGSAPRVRSRAARVRGVARSVRCRLGVLVRRLGVAQSPPAGVPRADVGRCPPLQGSSPAGDLRLRGRPRRGSRPGRVRGGDRRRRGLLDRNHDRVPAPRRACDRRYGDPAAGRRLPLRRFPRSDERGGGKGAAGGMAGRGGILLPEYVGHGRRRTGLAGRGAMGAHGAVRARPGRDAGGRPAGRRNRSGPI